MAKKIAPHGCGGGKKKETFAKGGFCLSNIIDTTDNFL